MEGLAQTERNLVGRGDADAFYGRERLKAAYESCGAEFGVKGETGTVFRNLPFDARPRVITAAEFKYLEKGLIQRVTALNAFLSDIYGECSAIRDGIVPPEFVFSSEGFLPRCVGIKPRKGIFAHIAGIDLVKDKRGNWFVLEDNLRVPSGASYPLTARKAACEVNIPTFGVENSLGYGSMLKDMFDFVSGGGINAVLTPGTSNCAFYEHAYLAENTHSALCTGEDLFVDGDALYFKGAEKIERVGCLYSRLDPLFADPLAFRRSSDIGVPNLFSAYASGNLAFVNAFGCGVADDKGLYCFVPQLIKYYLKEEPIIENAPTYLPSRESELKFIEENIGRLVVKSVCSSGGCGVVFGEAAGKERLETLLGEIAANPRNYIAQEVIDLETLPTDAGERRADFRAFVVSGESVKVWKSGLTRYAETESAFLVNSSQGGGFKDTWVLSQ